MLMLPAARVYNFHLAFAPCLQAAAFSREIGLRREHVLELVKPLPGGFCSGQMQMGLQTVRICGDPTFFFFFKWVSNCLALCFSVRDLIEG